MKTKDEEIASMKSSIFHSDELTHTQGEAEREEEEWTGEGGDKEEKTAGTESLGEKLAAECAKNDRLQAHLLTLVQEHDLELSQLLEEKTDVESQLALQAEELDTSLHACSTSRSEATSLRTQNSSLVEELTRHRSTISNLEQTICNLEAQFNMAGDIRAAAAAARNSPDGTDEHGPAEASTGLVEVDLETYNATESSLGVDNQVLELKELLAEKELEVKELKDALANGNSSRKKLEVELEQSKASTKELFENVARKESESLSELVSARKEAMESRKQLDTLQLEMSTATADKETQLRELQRKLEEEEQVRQVCQAKLEEEEQIRQVCQAKLEEEEQVRQVCQAKLEELGQQLQVKEHQLKLQEEALEESNSRLIARKTELTEMKKELEHQRTKAKSSDIELRPHSQGQALVAERAEEEGGKEQAQVVDRAQQQANIQQPLLETWKQTHEVQMEKKDEEISKLLVQVAHLNQCSAAQLGELGMLKQRLAGSESERDRLHREQRGKEEQWGREKTQIEERLGSREAECAKMSQALERLRTHLLEVQLTLSDSHRGTHVCIFMNGTGKISACMGFP